MFNKRVYLAKSNLASGFDFEYVKSNLLRIPDIEIIEYGDGVQPSECTCIVYVPEPQDGSFETLDVNKNVAQSMINHLDNGNNNIIFVYQTKNHSSLPHDVETTTPICYTLVELELSDEQSWDCYATAKMNTGEFHSLCSAVSALIGSGNSWVKNTRHYIPKKEFRLPPVPSVEQRRSKGTKGHYSIDEAGQWNKTSTFSERKENTKEEYRPEKGERERYSNAKSKRKERLL